MKDERTYIKVHDGIEDHPKIAPLSDKAFRVLVTTWGWCSRHHTDGRVPLAVWKKRATAKIRRELVDAQLVEETNDTAVMHDYLHHQRSSAEIEERREKKRRAGTLGNHKRWHADHPDPDCPHCIADGSQLRSQTVSLGDRKTSPETETETEVHIPVETLGGGVTAGDARATRPHPRCSKHRDNSDPPACRACGDARRSAEAWDAERQQHRDQVAAAIEAARRDRRQDCEHGQPGGLFRHPDTGESLCPFCRREAIAS